MPNISFAKGIPGDNNFWKVYNRMPCGRKKVFHTTTSNIKHFVAGVDWQISDNKHIQEEFFFILEGTATFYLDGKTITAGANTSFYCPSNIEHGISNAGDTELKYLVMQKYPKE